MKYTDEEFSVDGYWWLPRKKKSKAFGTLRYHAKNTIKLDLFDAGSFLKELKNDLLVPFIFGEDINGQKITLLQSFMAFAGFPAPKAKCTINSNIILTELHLGNDRKGIFSNVTVQSLPVREWATYFPNKEEKIHQPFSLEVRKEKFTLSDQMEIEVKVWQEMSGSDWEGFTLNKEEAFMTIQYKKPKNWTKVWQDLLALQKFSFFASNHYCGPSKTVVGFKEKGGETTFYGGVLFLSDFHEPGKPKHPTKILFSRSQMGSKVEKILSTWFEEKENFAPVLSLYADSKTKNRTKMPGNFLDLVMAVEALYDNFFETRIPDSKNFTQAKEMLLGIIPTNLSENEYEALRRRISDPLFLGLRTKLELLTKKIAVYDVEIADFLLTNTAEIPKLRAQFLHVGKGFKFNHEKIQTLLKISEALENVFEVVVLEILGFSKNNILLILNRRKQFQNYFFQKPVARK